MGGVVTSGGGFSNIYMTPPWQQQAIASYLEQINVSNTTVPYESDRSHQGDKKAKKQMSPPYPSPGFNSHGRGYPDVSMAGVNYLVIVNGSFYALSGTSASSPAFAGMISLLNAARKRSGRSTVGWINPALYESKGAFANDILAGDNTCYGFTDAGPCCVEGFYSAPGIVTFVILDYITLKKTYIKTYVYHFITFNSNQVGIL